MAMLDIKKVLAKMLKSPRVIESGVSGIWNYRKWSDGTAECWALNAGTYNLTQQYGGAYYASEISVNFPSNFFIAEPRVTVSRQGRVGLGLVGISPYSVTSSKITVYIYNVGMSLSNVQIGYTIYAIGKWK